LWQQYNELGGAVDHNDQPNPGNPAYLAALQNLDGDMPQYISDNTDDEISHAAFLTAYLKSKGVVPVDLTPFAGLQGSQATGANKSAGRITNLLSLNVDTSWYFRYRSAQNPDLGAAFPQLLNIVNQPGIPINDTDTPPGTPVSLFQPPITDPKARRMQAIANTAGPNPPSHAAKITAQSNNNAMASACSRRVMNSAATIATATENTAIE